MASTYSPNLRIELIGNGEQSNTWGTTTNTNLGTLIEQAISGLVSVDVTAGNVTLTSLNGASDQSRQMIIVATGTPGVTRTITAPAVNKVYIVYNNSNATLSFIASGGTGVSLSIGAKKLIYCDGTNFVEAINSVVITSGSIDGVAIGATTASTGKFTNLEYTGTLTGSTGVINIGSNQIYKDASGNIGIGSASLTGISLLLQKSLTGSTDAAQFYNSPTILSGVTSTASLFVTSPSTQASAFALGALTHYNTSFNTKGAGSSITNQYGFSAESSLTTATNNYAFTGNLASATGRYNLYMAGTADNYIAGSLGIGATTIAGINVLVQKSLTGSTDAAQIYNNPTILSGVTSTTSLFVTAPSTQAASFALGSLTHYNTSFNTKGAGSSITNQYGFSAASSLTTATNNYAFTGNLASATGRYNLYMSGTADNYIAGNLGVGVVPSGTYKLEVAGVISGTSLNITTAYPTVQPTLNLDFANSRLLDPRITFVRNSTATYYDNKTSALAEQNLLQYSQTFASPWATVRATVPASTIAAPDGTISGVLFTESSSAGTQFLTPIGGGAVTSGAGTYTFSIYGKNNGRYLTLAGNNGISNYISVIFDLSTGTYYQYQSGGQVINSVSCTQLGATGWYRCVVTATFTASSGINIAGSDVTTVPTGGYGMATYTGNGTSGFYLWGAQLEQRSAVTAYTPTTTAAITNYIPQLMTAPANVARLDCDPITRNSLGLLIEDSRVNLLTYSQTFTNAAWTLTNATLTSTANVAPDGTQTAFNLVDSTATGLQAIAQTYTKAASAIAYTSSVYFKANQRTYSWLQISDGAGNGAIVYFNLTTGVISTAVAGIGTAFTSLSATITLVGNSWYKCTITGTSNTATSLVTQFGSSTNGTSNSFTGNGYSGIYIWGAQLEAGAFATSYIPTVASTVTRAADVASMTGTNFSSWYNQSQGNLYAEYTPQFSTLVQSTNVVSIKSTASAGNYLGIYAPWGVVHTTRVGIPNVAYLDTGGVTYTENQLVKTSFSFSLTGFLSSTNGSLVQTFAAGYSTYMTNGTELIISTSGLGGALNGHIRKLSYYPVALSSSNLVALTS
jgi:hypothetical protein